MKSFTFKTFASSLTAVALALAASSSFAASTWSINLKAKCGDVGSQVQPSAACSNGDVSAVMSGWTTEVVGKTTNITTASLVEWNPGFGVQKGEADKGIPEHAMDNNGGTDMILLNFTNGPVALTSVNFGWTKDSDFSLMAYVGNDGLNNSTNINGKTLGGATGGLSASGWTLVGDYLNAGTGDELVNAGKTSSSWWLISAFNTGFGGNKTADNTADYLKLLSVSGTKSSTPVPPNNVPEPGSLALMGAALMGFVAARRRTIKPV